MNQWRLPTTELLSKVLHKEVSAIYPNLAMEENCINYTTYASFSQGTKSYDINIYELMNLMKEWAWSKHLITIRSGYAEFGAWSNFAHNNISFVSTDMPLTEAEAVTKACLWILSNKD